MIEIHKTIEKIFESNKDKLDAFECKDEFSDTQSHFDYVAEVLEKLAESKDKLKGYEIIEQPEQLRHFTAKLRPLT